jgi:hypothetical protein
MCPSGTCQEKPERHERIYVAESETTHHEGAADRKALNEDIIDFLRKA